MNKLLIQVRSLARRSGAIRHLVSIAGRLGLRQASYEEKFKTALLSAIRPGDTVWDVGANIGLYTVQFAEKVTPSGRVFAFEPAPGNFERLKRACDAAPQVKLLQKALGDKKATLSLSLSEDPDGVANSFVGSQGGAGSVSVDVLSADDVIAQNLATPANVMKIDVEGFEHEVIRGMSSLLANPSLKAIFMEVHFSLLEAKGDPFAPMEIEKKLVSAGFKTRWLDASHLEALR